jgi:Holliday junction resolvase RusA-like endonuclease
MDLLVSCHPADFSGSEGQETLFGPELSITIEIPGTPVSGNAKHRYLGFPGRDKHGRHKCQARGYTTKEAEAFEERVRTIALAAARLHHWKVPRFCRADWTLYNLRQDRVNAVKVAEDCLQRFIYENDGHVLDGFIRKIKDGRGPRLVATVTPVDGRLYGY